jgi:hypothetical protein
MTLFLTTGGGQDVNSMNDNCLRHPTMTTLAPAAHELEHQPRTLSLSEVTHMWELTSTMQTCRVPSWLEGTDLENAHLEQ